MQNTLPMQLERLRSTDIKGYVIAFGVGALITLCSGYSLDKPDEQPQVQPAAATAPADSAPKAP